jgi:N-acetylmuramoyl-L-alanine amidase
MAEGNEGRKAVTLESPLGGDYILIVNNWDSLGRRVSYSLSAVRGSGSPSNAVPLTLISASEGAGETHQAAAGPEVGDPGEVLPPDSGHTPTPAETTPQLSVGAGAKRVGIQAGHWKSAELPDELARLRTSTGTAGGGVPEWQLNLDVARRVATLLEAKGISVDIIPSTVPAGYAADAFVALHADGDRTGRLSGYKLAHGRWSGDPASDKALLDAIAAEYEAATRLAWDNHVSRNMTGYYSFSNRRFQHAVAAGTPAVILEMGFMTNRSDLRLLLQDTDTVARGIADGILRFLAVN